MRDFPLVFGFQVEANSGLSVTTEFEDETMLSSTARIPLLVLAVAAVALAGCDGSATPTAPAASAAEALARALASAGGADRIVDENVYDLTGSLVAVWCDDSTRSELIELEGQIYERFTIQFNSANGIHAFNHTMPIGLQGTGTESGEEFRVKEQDHGSFHQALGLGGTYRQVIKLESRMSKRAFSLVVRGHYTMNPNWDVVVEREKVTTVCEG